MTPLTLAAAQCISIAGDLPGNIARHLEFMRVAAGQGVQLLVFPELSLTGYEPGLAASLALSPEATLLQPLRDLARELGVTAVVGLPIRLQADAGVLIGALVLGADGRLQLYSKQHLHSGEEVFFTPGTGGSPLQFDEHRIALAVCADFAQASHAQAAADAGAGVYAAGVLISEQGYAADSAVLQGYARQHGTRVLMANHGGPTGGWVSAGRSAIWGEDGELIAASSGVGDQLVIARYRAGVWHGQVLTVEHS
jgi:predicted amidohydrolase